MTKVTNANPNSFLTLTAPVDSNAQAASSSNDNAFVSTQKGIDQFSSSIKNTINDIANVDSQINATNDETRKQELMNRKQALKQKRKELEDRQNTLKSRKSQIKSEMDTRRADADKAKNELSKLMANKSTLEKSVQNDNKELTKKGASLNNVNAQITATQAELDDAICNLNDQVNAATKKSEDELAQQRKAISAATTEALALVQNGEIKSEDMPSYIASKINGFNSVGNTSVGVIDANNTKIKALCSQLASFVDQQGAIQLSMKAYKTRIQASSPVFESLNSEIQAKNSELDSKNSLVDASSSELDGVNTEYSRNGGQITDLDLEESDIDTQIALIQTPSQDPTQKPAQVQAPGATQPAANSDTPAASNGIKYDQFFGSTNFKSNMPELNFDDAMEQINSKYEQTLKEDVKNTVMDELKSKMSDADKLILTLRNNLTDNAQKIIEERLDATKRK